MSVDTVDATSAHLLVGSSDVCSPTHHCDLLKRRFHISAAEPSETTN